MTASPFTALTLDVIDHPVGSANGSDVGVRLWSVRRWLVRLRSNRTKITFCRPTDNTSEIRKGTERFRDKSQRRCLMDVGNDVDGRSNLKSASMPI
jgi:hypothetical protein